MESHSPTRLSLDWTRVQDVCPIESRLGDHFKQVIQARNSLLESTGPGSEFTGWLRLLKNSAADALRPVQDMARRIAHQSDAVVVVGIGGSNLGAKAVYDALAHAYAQLTSLRGPSAAPLLFWAGHHLATDEVIELLDVLDGYTPSLIVISKSGTTTEPALGFRILKNYLDTRFGPEESSQRIFAITDPSKGTLKKMATENGWPSLEIPPDVGGRYSVFTACGLLPLAAAGVDTEAFYGGAQDAGSAYTSKTSDSLETNPALCYAAVRNALYSEGYRVEAHCTWSPKLRTISEWWKQLFGESDGKNGTGLYPASACFTTDLHSLGQYFQEGERILFATHLRVAKELSQTRSGLARSIQIPNASGVNDGFGFLNGENLASVQSHAQNGTFLAHADGKCPTLVWNIPQNTAYWLGYWMYTNFLSCAAGGYARGINPFDQPGVEAYKKNMFALLGQPGYADQQAGITERINRGRRLQSFGPTHGHTN